MTGKTVPELTAETPPIVDTDEVVVYRSPGPLKRTTATTFADYLIKLASSFIQTGTGAVARTPQARMRDTVSAFDFIPVAEHAAISAGTSTYNATAAVQAAIDTGKTVQFPEGLYQVVGLTMATNNQQLVALGNVNLQKRANGVILSSSADNIELNGITFRGESATPAFTGDNISLTGNAPRIINCGSLWAFGRALKATGNTVVIHGSNPIWQTTDATSNGFDIELGVSGTATLYHHLQDVYTSQATGGILMTDTGSHSVIGGLFGKYSILSGTSPAGSNSGTTIGARIIGNVQIGLSNGQFSGCAFSAITLTCLAGTSGITVDRSNIFGAGATVTNNGNATNTIQLDGGVGSYQSTKFGGTASLAVQAWDPSSGNMLMPAGDILINGTDKGIRLSNNGHGLLPSGNNLALANTLGSTQVIPAGTLQLGGTNTNSVDITASGVSLLSGKVIELGDASDTTIARASAGNISVEGNLVYRAGGTDVPITDGGTGSSTAADARTALAVVGTADLAASTGATLVGTVASGTGAVTRTAQAKIRDTVSVLDFIPVAEHAAILAGTSTYDATADLQAAIAANLGKTIDLPAGQIVLGNVGGLASAGQRIIGNSRYGTVIKAKSGMTAATAIFYNPNAATTTSAYMELANLRFRFDGQNIIGIDLSSLNNTVVDQCYFAGSEAGSSLIGVGVRFGSPLDSGSYSNNVRDCAFYSLAKGVEYLINANSNMISGGECIVCTIGVDAAPTGYLDTPRIHGMRFEGCGTGIKEKSVGATYFQCRFEDNSVADISFINNGSGDQSIRPQLIGGETATSPVSLLNVSNAVSPIIIAPDMGRYDIDATSTPKYYGGRHIFATTGTALPPASNPPSGYSVCFIDPPYLKNQIPMEGINAAGTNTVIMMTVNGSDELEISGFKRASSTYANIRIGGGSAVAPLTNGGCDLGLTGARWKDGYFSGNIYSGSGALSLEGAGGLVYIDGKVILRKRVTGWATATGTATRTTFDTATVTTEQLAQRLKALIDDLHSATGSAHGLLEA